MKVGRALSALLVWGGIAHAQRPVVRVIDPGFGAGPEVLQQVVAGPHVVIPPAAGQAVLARDTIYHTSVIILGRDAAVDGTVTGDVLVVGGDLHVHPHANITGRAIAIGGAVYPSAMATIGGGYVSYRDITYEIAPVPNGFELRYVSLVNRPQAAITLPGIYGFGIPGYDRTDGLSIPFGPLIAVPGTKLIVEPRVTYRSQLGRIDPAVDATLPFDSRTEITVTAQRGTFTNEAWIWSSLLNSLATITSGDDNRNYYRADRVDASLSRAWKWSNSTLTPYIGARWERGESARPDSFATGGPWSFRGRHDREDMLRANPPIDSGTIVSGVIGARIEQDANGIKARAGLEVEVGGLSPKFGSPDGGSRSFGQATFDGRIEFSTFGTQSLQIDGHAVVTAAGDLQHDRVSTPQGVILIRTTNTPHQRWAYVGGLGSIPTINMLSRGGDELVYLDGRYNIPIDRIQLPLVGPPVVTLREVLGGADIQRWPSLAQATGVRVSVSAVYAEYMFDPSSRHGFFGVGLSLAR